jgi:hypothetical protein
MRQWCVLALLAANAVFLTVAVFGLIFVGAGWADGFGIRSAQRFDDFTGPVAIGLPVIAVLLATHVAPMVPRSFLVLRVALAEYGVSWFFGVITFLGAFAHDLDSVRATLEGLFIRATWLGLVVLAAAAVYRVYSGLFPSNLPRRYAVYTPPTYGRPYAGQPTYPAETPSSFDDVLFNTPTSDTGWAGVPTPPLPPEEETEATMRVHLTDAETGGDATQLMPPAPRPFGSPAEPPSTAS